MTAPIPRTIRRERIQRYLAGEPVRLIAKDHGVTVPAILHTITRYAHDAPRRYTPRS